jgi:hypothetical protein
MERINQFEFYKLSKVLGALTVRSDDTPPREVVFDLLSARGVLTALLNGKPLPLGVSKPSARALLSNIEDLISEHCMRKGRDGAEVLWPDETSPIIPAWRWSILRRLLDTFETVFSEEMKEATAYFVPRRGIFSTSALVDSADESFPEEIVKHIPHKARVEWRSAGRCLAFNLLSASGFHVARAVEGTLEVYYQKYCAMEGKTLLNWGNYISELEQIQKSEQTPIPEEKTLSELRQMKDDYRNPLMHPRVVLSESDARMLFNNGESLIIATAQEIGVLAQGAIQQSLQIPQGIPLISQPTAS